MLHPPLRSLITLLMLAAAVALPSDVLARNYFVGTGGSDANDGKSRRTSFATIQHAANVARNGDTVYVASGVYTDDVMVLGKKSTQPLQFMVDASGSRSSDRPSVVISGATFRVAGSNNVQVQGFSFSGGAAHPLIWQDSFDGVVAGCSFAGGEKSVLIKSGSLTLSGCRFTGFESSAIQVDGETIVQVNTCAIKSGDRHGIEIRKPARVTVDGSTIEGNAGDGVHATLGSGDVDVPEINDGCECSGTPPLSLRQQAYDILRTLNPRADRHRDEVREAKRLLRATLYESRWKDAWHPTIAAGPDIFSGSVETQKKLEALLSDDVDFDIIGDDLRVNHPFQVEVLLIGAAITSGNYKVPVTTQLKVASDTLYPFGSFGSPTSGNVNDNNNPRQFRSSKTYDAGERVSLSGRSWTKRYGHSGSKDWHFRQHMTVSSAANTPYLYTLRDGSRVPGVSGLNGQQSAEVFLRPYIGDGGRVSLAPNQAIFLFELGTTNVNSSAADFQDLVALVTLRRPEGDTSDDGLTDEEKAKIKQAMDLIAEADRVLSECAINEGVCAGGNEKGLKEATDHYETGSAKIATNELPSASSFFAHAWKAAKKSTGNRDPDSGAKLERLVEPAPPRGWRGVTAPELRITRSSVTNNDSGVVVKIDQHFSADTVHLDENAKWGFQIKGGTWAIEGSSIDENGVGGILLTDVRVGNFKYYDVDVKDNVTYGVYALDCDLKFTSSKSIRGFNNIDWLDISGSEYTWLVRGGRFELNTARLYGGKKAAIRLMDTTFTASNCRFQSDGYGVFAEGSSVLLKGCLFHDGNVGLYAGRGNTCKLAGTTFKSHRSWGAVVSNQATVGVDASLTNSDATSASFANCKFEGNGGGLSLVELRDGEFTFQDTVIRNSAQNGLHLVGCNLALTGVGLTLSGNNYGVSSNQSTLALDGIAVDSSRTVGLYATGSTVMVDHASLEGAKTVHSVGGTMTVKRSKLTGTSGYGVESNNSNFTLVDSTLEAPSGVYAHAGGSFKLDRMRLSSVHRRSIGVWSASELTVTNSILDGMWAGIVGVVDPSTGAATVQNATVANATGYGVYFVGSGDATLQNTIVDGTSGYLGVYKPWQVQLTHSHNLVNGFRQPFYGVTQGETEKIKDPLFKDKAAGDLRLDAGSPAINAGLDLGLTVSTDILGNARPSYDVFEIGAYEYLDKKGSFRVLEWKEKR